MFPLYLSYYDVKDMKYLYLSIAFFVITVPLRVIAQINTNYDIALGRRDLIEIVVSLINLLLSILALFSVIMIIIGGLMWLTSAGNEEKAKKARILLRNALVGVIIILSSWAMVTWFLDTFGSVTNTPVI